MVESANGAAGIVAVRSRECQRTRPQTSRLNSSLLSRRPRVVRTTRSSAVTSSSSAASAQPKLSPSGGSLRRPERDATVRAQAEDHGLGRRGRRVDRLGAAGRQRRGPPARRRERADVAIQPGRIPAPGHAVEGVRAGTDGLVRPALPVGEVVAALVARPCPVADLVAVPAVRQAVDGVVVLGRGAVLVLGRSRRRPPAARARRRRQVVAARRRSALRRRGRRASARRATGGRARARAPPRACRSSRPASRRARRTGGRG